MMPAGRSRTARCRTRRSTTRKRGRWSSCGVSGGSGVAPAGTPACAMRGSWARGDDLVEVIGRALDPHEVRILQAAVVIDRHRGVVALVLDQQLDGLPRILGRSDRRLEQ